MPSRFAILFFVFLAGCTSSSSPTAPSADTPNPVAASSDEKLRPEEAKALVAEAAGVKRGELDKLAAGPETNIDPQKLKNLPLSLLCYFLHEAHDFHFHRNRSSFAQFALAIGESREMAYGSVILPDQIANCSCETTGETAKGALSFKTGDICEGRVEFTAQRHDGHWRIEQLWLPADEIGVYLGEHGNWKIKAAGMTPAQE